MNAIRQTDLTYYVMMVIAFLVYLYNKICDSQDANKEHFTCCNTQFKSMDLLNTRVNTIKKKINSMKSNPISSVANKIKIDLSNQLNQINKSTNTLDDNIYALKQNFNNYHPMDVIRKRETDRGKELIGGMNIN